MINPVLAIEVRVREKVKERRKSDSRGAEDRDRGSVSVTSEGKQKQRLTGEPVRIDQPTSSCHRELIWHQQSFCVKQEKGQEDPCICPHMYICDPAPH